MKACEEFIWSDWIPLTKLDDVKCGLLGRGVFVIGAGLQSGKPVPIQRVLGRDTQGIIYVGEGVLARKIGVLLNFVREDCDNRVHFATEFFANMCLSRIFDSRFLLVRWCESENPRGAESKVLDSYMSEFGELPPGNTQPDVNYVG